MQITTMSPTSIKARDRLLAEPMNNMVTKSIEKGEGLLLQGKKISESPAKP